MELSNHLTVWYKYRIMINASFTESKVGNSGKPPQDFSNKPVIFPFFSVYGVICIRMQICQYESKYISSRFIQTPKFKSSVNSGYSFVVNFQDVQWADR